MALRRDLSLMLLREPILQELNRRVVAERGMVQSIEVIPHFLEDEISGEAHYYGYGPRTFLNAA